MDLHFFLDIFIISVQPKSDLLKFIVIKNATDLGWQQQVLPCVSSDKRPAGDELFKWRVASKID